MLWLGVLGAAAGWLLTHTQVASDLTAFLPAAGDETESLLLDELREGAAARLMPMAVDAPDLETAAAVSRSLGETLRKDERFTRVHNGQQSPGSTQLEWVMRHRYLLSSEVKPGRFTQDALREALEERLMELGSAAELALKDLLARDPTHESLAILKQWRPANEPPTRHGVWVQPDTQRALLMAETRAPAFDLDAQEAAVQAVQTAFANAVAEQGLAAGQAELTLTGPGPFGVELRHTTQREAQWFSTLAVLLLLGFLYWIYRSVYRVLLSALPLATGLAAAILLVNLGYGGVHGITLAFGVTLLGVAIDYPLHLLSHSMPGHSPLQSVRRIWPTLRLGVASTCVAYLTLVISDFEGLAQLGWLTVIGLTVAAAATRWGLPRLMGEPGRDARSFDAAGGWATAWQARLARIPRLPWWLMLLLIIGLLALLSTRGQLWQDDLGSLTPVPKTKQLEDRELRRALAAPDLRYLAVLHADSAEQALQASEELSEALAEAAEHPWLAGYDSPSRYLPSRETQRRRQAALPDSQTLAANLAAARAGLPFRDGLFEPFVKEVAQAKIRAPLTPDDVKHSPLAAQVSTLLGETGDGRWRALLPLRGVTDSAALSEWFAERPGIQLLDLKQSSETMVAGFRDEMLWRIAAATAVILVILLAGLRPRRRSLFVLLPVLATVLMTASLLHLLGVRLSLFHMTSLMLVGGIVLDYALFFDRAESDDAEAARTLHALTVCCVSTVTVFGILALSQIPVLRAIGSTVACGVVLGYLLGALGRRR